MLLDRSDARGLESSVFCIEQPIGPWGEQLLREGISVTSFPRRPGFDLQVILAIREHLKKNRIDIVHCHQYTPWVYGALGAMGLKTKVVFTEHGRFYPDSASFKRRFINPVLAAMTDRITAISKATKEALVNFEYLKRESIQTVYNGISPITASANLQSTLRAKYEINEDCILLGTIARFDPVKNHRMMIEAFYEVAKHHPECRLVIVGDGEERSRIEATVDRLGLASAVILPGYISDPSPWIAAIDIFLLSSDTEGTSMTLLEAMSLAKPSVVTNVGGNPEIVLHPTTGRVSPRADADQFAHEILRLMASNDILRKTGLAAQNRFKAYFHSSVMQSAYDDIYASIAR